MEILCECGASIEAEYKCIEDSLKVYKGNVQLYEKQKTVLL